MNPTLFTIITISYNSSATIERTIKSVLSQTISDFEYIIVDGASTDTTLDIVKKYEPLFGGRLHWQSEPDKGIYDAMNKGIGRSSGQLIGIVNSDDWLEPDALQKVFDAYQKNNCDNNTLYCGGIKLVSKKDEKRMPVNLEKFRRQASLYVMAGVRHPGVVVPKSVYDKYGVFNSQLRLSADQDFILRCYYKGVSFNDINAIISNMAEGGLSTGGGKKAWLMAIADREIMLKNFGKSGLSLYWLMFSWRMRNYLRNVLVKIGLYK